MKTFKEYFEVVAANLEKVWSKEHEVHHVVILLDEDESGFFGNPIDFDTMASSFTGAPIELKRKFAFESVSKVIETGGFHGYIDISEGYQVVVPHGMSDQESVDKLLKKYGSVAAVPTRIEFLYAQGRWRNERLARVWKILRREGAPPALLADPVTSEAFATPMKECNKKCLDDAVDAVVGRFL